MNQYSVKNWLESSLASHVLFCNICVPLRSVSRIKISVVWKNVSYLVCSFLDGKLRQCLLSLEDVETHRYSHCGLISRLQRKAMSATKAKPISLLSPASALSYIIDKKHPAWLFYNEDLYKLHLSDHTFSFSLQVLNLVHVQAILQSRATNHPIYQKSCLILLRSVINLYLYHCRNRFLTMIS
jgi:hypothetical protein